MLGKGCISVMVVRSILRIQTRPLSSAALWLTVIYIAVINSFFARNTQKPSVTERSIRTECDPILYLCIRLDLSSQGYFCLSNMV